jgi:ADP-ribose pyrophosphatase YjhB (NUDIX family)
MTDEAKRQRTDRASLTDLDALRTRGDVEFLERTRALEQRKFEALRKRYQSIDGVVQVGVTDDDGAVLLVGPDPWAPPGGNVDAGEDWAAAARRAIADLTGVAVTVDGVERVEETYFCLESDEDSRFLAPSVLFSASPAEEPGDFRADPTVASDLDDPLYGDGEDVELAWFEEVPGDAHPNHVDHIELFLG